MEFTYLKLFDITQDFDLSDCHVKRGRESYKRQKENPPFESQGSEQTPLSSKLSLREESRCGWIYS